MIESGKAWILSEKETLGSLFAFHPTALGSANEIGKKFELSVIAAKICLLFIRYNSAYFEQALF